MESNISENVTPKLVGMIVAIIVLACVMIPICNSLVSDGNGGGSGSGEITASNEQYALSKMAYGTNPTFEITPSNEESSILGCYKMAVLYADSTNLIYRYSENEGERVYHIITDSFNTLSDATNVSTISTVVSDGHTVTVNYVDSDSNSQQYSFDIASPCYYADANGEYGLYINPSVYQGMAFPPGMTPPSVGYDSLYIPNDYTPHIIGATALDLNMAYDNGYIFGYTGGSIRNFSTYTTVSNNQITDAGWHYDIRPEGSEWENDVINHCYFLILPNKVTYTPSNTLDNPEPYSMKYSYAEGTIPDFSMTVATNESYVTTVTTENGTVTINPSDSSKNIASYVVLATNNSYIGAFAQGMVYANEDGTMYLIISATIQCADGQISLTPKGDSIVDISSMTPVSGTVTIGTFEWCYYADPNGDYGNYADTQIGNGLYYDSTKPLCSVGNLGSKIFVYRNIELSLNNPPTIDTLTYTPTTSDNLFTGASWPEIIEEEETVDAYFTILPTSISADNGGSGGDDSTGGVSGISATIIKLLPVFVAIGLILAMVSMFYDPRQLLGGQQ